jgi:uncharacterized protein YkwD
MARLPVLTWSDGVALAARKHCDDSATTGSRYLLGSDGSMTWGRISAYGSAPATVAENLSFGYEEAKDIVMSLFIGHGSPNSRSRNNMLDLEIS